MKILITGGTGFFGKALLRHLAAQQSLYASRSPLEVVVLTRSPQGFLRAYPEFAALPWLRLHQGDICQPQTLPGGEKFTHILHAAADSTDAAGLNHLQRYDQIAGGTRNLLQFAVTEQVPRFLLTSSGGAYGPQPQHLAAIPETWNGMPDPLDPQQGYGVAKRAAEHLCAIYRHQYGIETVIARCFAFVGEDLPLEAHFAIGNFIRDALFADAIVVGGDGSPVRSYLYQGDLAAWLMVLLMRGTAGSAYNVGSSEALTIAELAGLVRDILAPAKEVRIAGKPNPGQQFRNRYVPDISKASGELGVAIEVSLAQAIRISAAGKSVATA